MGKDKKGGETYLNYTVPKKDGDANGFQAGATFKLFVLAAAINQGIPLSTAINSPQTMHFDDWDFETCDGPYAGDQKGWDPQNSTGFGSYNLYSGTQKSVNTFFAQLEKQTGLSLSPTLLWEHPTAAAVIEMKSSGVRTGKRGEV
jgi:hypothetical protein